MPVTFSQFANSLVAESAFTVLALAKELKAAGKDVVELEIGDSPFPSPAVAVQQAINSLQAGKSRYCPSLGVSEFREAAADCVRSEFGIPASLDNIAVVPGAKPIEQFFCEAFLNTGDGVLVFSPQFPTYEPNILRRGARMVQVGLQEQHGFRPRACDVEEFLRSDAQPKAIFLNSPQNPTGGVATESDLAEIADVVRGRDIAVFSDEPYCHMVWEGEHHSIAAQPDILDQCVAAYTFSKSYSMSGWRLGFCVASVEATEMIGKLINSTLSCVPPFVQSAGIAALRDARRERDVAMEMFRDQVFTLTEGLNAIDGFHVLPPAGTFYVFANVSEICKRHGITSHGLALYLLSGADASFGVACVGGECFGGAGMGFLRFSCAESNQRIRLAVEFIARALSDVTRLKAWVACNELYSLPS